MAVFVVHQRHRHGRSAQGAEGIEGVQGIGQHRNPADMGAQIELLAAEQRADQIADLQNPNHRVGTAIGNRQPGVRARQELRPHAPRVVGEIDPDHVGARCHHRADQPVAQPQHPCAHRPLAALDDACGFGLGHEATDLLLGHCAGALRLLADQPEHGPGRGIEEPDSRQRHLGDHAHAGCHRAGDTLGVAQGEVLRDEFADDHRQEGDQTDDESVAEGIGPAPRRAEFDQHDGNPIAQRRAREDARQDADQRDADLRRGE